MANVRVTPDIDSCLFLGGGGGHPHEIIDEMAYINTDIAPHPTNSLGLEKHLSIHCLELFHQSLLLMSIWIISWARASFEGAITDGVER